MRYSAGVWGAGQQHAEKKRQQILQEIGELEQRLQVAQARLGALKSGEVKARTRSRRQNPVTDLTVEALQEIGSYIFTLELKLRQKRGELELLDKPRKE